MFLKIVKLDHLVDFSALFVATTRKLVIPNRSTSISLSVRLHDVSKRQSSQKLDVIFMWRFKIFPIIVSKVFYRNAKLVTTAAPDNRTASA